MRFLGLGLAAVAVTLGFACGDSGSVSPSSSSSSGTSSTGTASTSTSTSTSGGGMGGATTSTSSGGGAGAGGATSTSSGMGGASSSGTSTSSTSTSSSGLGGAGGAGAICQAGQACDQGYFCDAPGCGQGKCAEIPSPAAVHGEGDPVCGCNGITYWNQDVASYDGAAVKGMGVCSPNAALVCDANTPCPAGVNHKCNRQVNSIAGCNASPKGVCWGLPIQCPILDSHATACTNQACENVCSLISSENPWWSGPNCP